MFHIESGAPSTPSGLAFTGNPAVMSAEMPGVGQPVAGYPLRVDVGARTVYSARVHYPFTLDVADVADAYAPPLPETGPMLGCGFIRQLEDDAAMGAREVYAAVYGEADHEFGFIALPGGVGPATLRRLDGEDIFAERFLRPWVNFFLTTRTAGWRLEMRETELEPLCFIFDGTSPTLELVETLSGKKLTAVLPCPGVYALDLEAARRIFYDRDHVLGSVFEVWRSGSFACRVAISAAEASRERHVLRFRNSLGVFERFELTGAMTRNLWGSDPSEEVYSVFDRVTGRYDARRDRLPLDETLTVSTGFKTPSEVRFMFDMLASGEVYLLGYAEDPVRVIPSIEEADARLRPEAPQTFRLTLKVASENGFLTPEADPAERGGRPRVFADAFSSEFN